MIDNIHQALDLFAILCAKYDIYKTFVKELAPRGQLLGRVYDLAPALLLKRNYIVCKKEWFKAYGKTFPGQQGIGQSCNVDMLREAGEKENAAITFVMQDAKVYSVIAAEWLKFAEENNTIRPVRQKDGTVTIEASIPVTMCKRVLNSQNTNAAS